MISNSLYSWKNFNKNAVQFKEHKIRKLPSMKFYEDMAVTSVLHVSERRVILNYEN